jgi:hypothetical protein
MLGGGRGYILAVAAVLSFTAVLSAQTTFATITGTATDASGATVPGVTVTATNIESGIPTSVQSNEAGVYTLAQLKEGTYTVRAQRPGFKEFVAENVVLRARDYRRLDVLLEVGAVDTKIEVTGGATLIETETARISDTKDATLLKTLPLNTRSLTAYLALSPNVLSAGYGLSYRRFAGSRGNQGDVGIDGISTSTAYDGSQISPLVGYIESFEEVRVDMASNSAEYGAIGQVTVISKSGTNQLHGNVFNYYSTPWFRARDPFAQQRTTGISHQPGGSIGGPVVLPKIYNGRNKTFFFFSYETSAGSAAQDFLNPTVPLEAWRRGDFSGIGTVIRDPLTGVPFANNQIPASQINPVSQRIQDRFYPLPNYGDTAVFASANYREYKIRAFDPNSYYTARVDHRLSDRSFFYVRWTWNQAWSRQFLGNLPGIGQNSQRRDTRAANFSYTYNIRPHLVNEFRAGVSFNNNPITPPTLGKQVVQDLGITGLVDNLPDLPGMPHFSFSGLSLTPINQGSSYNYRRPGNREFNYSFQDLATWFHGRHSVKAGIIVAPHFHADKSTDANLFGSASFSNRFTGYPYADFLLGIPTTVNRAYPPLGYKRHWLQNTLFVTDDFKITPKLTINAGLRYEYTTNFTEANGREAMFDIGSGKIVVPNGSLSKVSPLLPRGYVDVIEAKDIGLPGDTLLKNQHDFAPRVGLAYRPWGNRTVFRAGFGIFFDMVPRGGVSPGSTPFLINEPAFTNPAVPTVIFPRIFPAAAAGPTTVNIPSAINPDMQRPYSMQYTATIEHQRWDTGFRISYIGTNTRQGQWSYNINQPVPDTRLYVDKPRMFPNYPAINYVTNGAGHQYHSLTVTAERRMTNGIHYQLSYTLARDIGDLDLGQSPENAYDRQRERSVWEDIPTHRVGGNFIYELPFGRGKHYLSGANAIVRHIVGNWSISGIYSMTSGNFLTPLWTGPDPTGTAYTTSRTPAQVTIRPNYLFDANLPSDQQTVTRWYDVQAFAAPTPGMFGSAAKGVIKGPGVSVVDAGISKDFLLTEYIRLRWDVTATNFFNHPNWSVPGLNITDLGGAGVITAASGTHSLDQPGARAFRMSLRVEW